MSIIDDIIEKAGFIRKSKAVIPSVTAPGGTDPFAIWKGTKKVDASKAFDVYSGWVYACIRAIAEEIAKMRFKLMRINADGTEEEISEHELLDLLEGVNPHQTGMEIRYTIAAHLEAIGNAYLYLDGVGDGDTKAKPSALYLLDASRTKVLADRESFPGAVLGFKYRTTSHEYTFDPAKIIHLKYSDPADPFEGIGTVQTAAQWIDADNYAMEFNRRFFLNGARIGGFIEAQQAYTTDQLEYLKKSFEAAHVGVSNAHKTVALPVGTKYTEAGSTQKDLDFANMMMMMRDRILAAFRVPRTALGITDDVNRANAEATDYVFAARTIAPKMEMICSYLNEFLVPRYGDDIYLTFEDPVPENRELLIREMAAALGNAPAISVNEAREKYFGLDKIIGGDAVQIPFSMSPLGEPEPKSMNKPTTRGNGSKRRKTRNARSADLRKGIAADLAKAILKDTKKIEKAVKQVKKKGNIAELEDDQFEPIYKAFKARVTNYEKLLAEKIRGYNGDQKEEVLGNLETIVKSFNAKTKAIDPNDLIDGEHAVQALIDLATPILAELYEKEGKEAAALIGITDIEILTPEVRKALEQAIELMAGSYNDETLALLKAKLSEGIDAGLGMQELTDLVGEIYEFSDQTRAERVARTETFRIANEATKETWKQTGVVKTIKWYTADDERVCPYCEPMHGKIIDIEENFFDKGDTVEGSDGSKFKVDYAPISAGSLHVNCRCYTRPEEVSLEA